MLRSVCRRLVDATITQRHRSASAQVFNNFSAILKKMSELPQPKKGAYKRQAHKLRTKKDTQHPPGRIWLQVIGTGAPGAPSSVYLFSDQNRCVTPAIILILLSLLWVVSDVIDILSTAAKEHSVWRKNIDWDCRNWSMFSWREQVGHDLVEYPACHWPFRMQKHRRSRCMDHRNLVNCSVRCEDSLCCGRYRYSGQPAMPANATRITCWRWPTYRWQSM